MQSPDDVPEVPAALSGAVVSRALDAQLQGLVEEAAARLAAPIAIVSILLRRTQFFRAWVGLPPDLASARSTDRCASFCQYVVRDRAAFTVEDAFTDARVPQALPERYGIRAYLGVPVRVGATVVGSFCVIDVVPRTFDDAQRAVMEALAVRVSARLTELASPALGRASTLFAAASEPSFRELRNVLGALSGNVAAARHASLEASARARALEGLALHDDAPAAASVLPASPAIFDELDAILDDLDVAAERLVRDVLALEGLVRAGGARCSVREVIDAAAQLGLHATRVVGGVTTLTAAPDAAITQPRAVAVGALAAALAALAGALSSARRAGGIALSARATPDHVELSAACGLDDEALTEVAAGLCDTLGDEVPVRVEPGAISLRFDRAR